MSTDDWVNATHRNDQDNMQLAYCHSTILLDHCRCSDGHCLCNGCWRSSFMFKILHSLSSLLKSFIPKKNTCPWRLFQPEKPRVSWHKCRMPIFCKLDQFDSSNNPTVVTQFCRVQDDYNIEKILLFTLFVEYVDRNKVCKNTVMWVWFTPRF